MLKWYVQGGGIQRQETQTANIAARMTLGFGGGKRGKSQGQIVG
jgi:hypothetical protein